MPLSLADQVRKFEMTLADIRQAVREGHQVLRDLRDERRNVERMLTTDVKKMVNDRVEKVVKAELDRIAPEIRASTTQIYQRVGDQADKLINIALGSEFSTRRGKEDIRPVLEAQLRKWIREVLESEGVKTDGVGDPEIP